MSLCPVRFVPKWSSVGLVKPILSGGLTAWCHGWGGPRKLRRLILNRIRGSHVSDPFTGLARGAGVVASERDKTAPDIIVKAIAQGFFTICPSLPRRPKMNKTSHEDIQTYTIISPHASSAVISPQLLDALLPEAPCHLS